MASHHLRDTLTPKDNKAHTRTNSRTLTQTSKALTHKLEDMVGRRCLLNKVIILTPTKSVLRQTFRMDHHTGKNYISICENIFVIFVV